MACSGGSNVRVHSETPKETRHFTWKVANFKAIKKSKELIKLQNFSFEMGASIHFPVKLHAYMRSEQEDKDPIIALYLKAMDSPPGATQVYVSAAFTIRKYKCRMISGRRFTRNLLGTHECGWTLMFQKWPLLMDKLLLDPNGNLVVHLKVTLFNAEDPQPQPSLPMTITTGDLIAKFQSSFLQTLSQEVNNLHKEPLVNVSSAGTPLEIVTLVSREGTKFPANRLLLAARSPVFREMLQTHITKEPDDSELESGVMKMDDIGEDALEVFLHYLNTATLLDKWIEPGIPEELTRAAFKFHVKDLLDFLDEALVVLCTSANCAKLIGLARSLELKKAERGLLHVYKEQWKEVTDPEEMMRLFAGAAEAAISKQLVSVKGFKMKWTKFLQSFLKH